MRKLRVRRPSAAMIVAVVALCFALVGTGLAASSLTGHEKKQVRKIINKKAGKLHVATAGTADNVLAALVPNGDSCAITSQTGGITATLVGSGQTGVCDVTFPRSVDNCVVGATAEHPLQDISGQALVRYLGGAKVRVTRRNGNDTFQAAGLFSIFAVCPA